MTPRYTDHHVHLMATAATLLSLDLSRVRSLAELTDVLRDGSRGAGGWIRAWGYEEWQLAERRHPHRGDLDAAVPHRPAAIHHRSGHAVVLNSLALAEVGEADHPDGVLVDRHEVLARVPRLGGRVLQEAATATSAGWAAAGVAAVVDATHTNGPAEIETLAAWLRSGAVRQSVTAMVSPSSVGSVPPYGSAVGGVTIGPVKLMPGSGSLDGLRGQVVAAHAGGYPVAVHVTDVDVLDATLAAMEASPPPPGTVDRIEHNSFSLPEQVERIAGSRATVVVNPSFLVHRRPKYEHELTPLERTWLVRMGSLVRAGVRVRAGSDSPVVPASPTEMMAAAQAHPFAAAESVDAMEAARMLED
jgi:predicted amidohydrolase YtcJ